MPHPDPLQRLAELDTHAVCDALDFLQLPGAVVGIRPLWDCPKVVGRASTVKLAPKTDAAPGVHLISPVIDAITTDDRVLVVPRARAEAVARTARQIETVESQIRAQLEAGKTLKQARESLGYHTLQRQDS